MPGDAALVETSERPSDDSGTYDPNRPFVPFLRGIATHLLSRFVSRVCEALPEVEADTPASHAVRPAFRDALHRQRIPPQGWVLARFELIAVACGCGSKPHHVLAFMFVKLLEWRPREIWQELLDVPLGSLYTRFVRDYDRFLHDIGPGIWIDQRRSLARDLSRSVGEVYVEAEYGRLRSKRHQPVRRLAFRDLLTPLDDPHVFSDWCDRVRNRAKALVESGVRSA